MRAGVAPGLLLLVATATMAQGPAETLAIRGWTVRLARNGTFDLSEGTAARLQGSRLIAFGRDWRSVSQTAAGDVQVSTADGVIRTEGRLTEVGAGQDWRFVQRLRVEGDTLRCEWELTAARRMWVNELSWMADLPIAAYRGRRVLLLPGEEATLPEQMPKQRHFVSAAASRCVFAAGEPWQWSLDLDHPRLCNVQDTREFKGDVYQPFIKLLDGAREVAAGERFTLAFTLHPADARRHAVARLALASDRPLRLGEVRCQPATPQAGELVTLNVDLAGRWRTPFWSEEVALDAQIQGGGRTWRVPGCTVLDYRRQVLGGRELLEPVGEPTWQVRFLPPQAGDYQVVLTARDGTGTVSRRFSFTATAGTARPYLRVSRSDRHYFEFTDGTPYFANGLNVCWYRAAMGTSDYDDWFGKLGAAGGNYARVWMPDWAFGYEWGRPGEYRQDHAWQFDRVLQLAQQHGIRIKLCLEAFRTFGRGNPYAKANGGPCDQVLDVFTNADAQRMWRNRLRYAVARWGWSPNLLAWEFWNEIDCVQGYQAPVVQAWARDMSRYLRQEDPFGHLIVNSLGSFVYEPDLWRSAEMDFAQMHGYWHPKWKSTEFGRDMAQMMADHVAMVRRFDKPCFFAEFGLVNETWGPSPRLADDPDGVNLHNGMWGAMMAGAAGTAHLWWWDNYVAPRNLWYHFRGVARYIAGVRWNTEGFEPGVAESTAGVRAMTLRGRTQTLVWAQNRAHTWWQVAEKQPVPPVTAATVTLPELRGALRVERWDPWTGEWLAAEDVTAGEGGLTVNLGTVARDVAVKVERR